MTKARDYLFLWWHSKLLLDKFLILNFALFLLGGLIATLFNQFSYRPLWGKILVLSIEVAAMPFAIAALIELIKTIRSKDANDKTK